MVGIGRTLLLTSPNLYPHNQAVANLLKGVQVAPEEYFEALLVGVRMSPSWRHRGKMPIFYTVVDGN